MNWLKMKKIILKGHLLFFYIRFFSYSVSDCDMWQKVDFIWEPAMTSSVVRPRRSFKALPKAKLAPKKGYGHRLVVCCQSDPLQFCESQQNQHIWEVCSANQWDAPKATTPAAGIDQQKGPSSPPWKHLTAHHTTNTSKAERMGYEVLHHPPYSPDLSSTDYHFFKHLDNFLQGKVFQSQQKAGNALQEFIKSLSMDLILQG